MKATPSDEGSASRQTASSLLGKELGTYLYVVKLELNYKELLGLARGFPTRTTEIIPKKRNQSVDKLLIDQ